MACSAGFASAPVSGKQLRAVAIQGSLSLALALGQAVQQAQRIKADPVAAAVTAANGKLVFKGAKLLSVIGHMFKAAAGPCPGGVCCELCCGLLPFCALAGLD